MTAIVGILCQQAVVIGTDSSATFSSGSQQTIEQPIEKLLIVADNIIVVGSGQVGLGQRFSAIVEKAWADSLFKNQPLQIGKYLSRTAIEDFASTHAGKGTYGALVAFPAKQKVHLCEFAVQDLQPEFKTEQMWYCSMGVTQTITDSFLALMRGLFWQSGPPTVNDGIFAVTWALDHAVEVNPGGVNKPIRVAVLDTHAGQAKAEMLPDMVIDEHRQNINGAKDALREYCRNLHRTDEATPNVPRPAQKN